MNDTNTTNIVVPVPQISWLPKLHEVQGVERNDQVFRGIIQDANRYLDFVGQVLRPGKLVVSDTKREQFEPSGRGRDEDRSPVEKTVRDDIISEGIAVNTALATTDSLDQMWRACRKHDKNVTDAYYLFAVKRRDTADDIIKRVSGMNVRLESWNSRFAAHFTDGPARESHIKLLKRAKPDILEALDRTLRHIGTDVDEVYRSALDTAKTIKAEPIKQNKDHKDESAIRVAIAPSNVADRVDNAVQPATTELVSWPPKSAKMGEAIAYPDDIPRPPNWDSVPLPTDPGPKLDAIGVPPKVKDTLFRSNQLLQAFSTFSTDQWEFFARAYQMGGPYSTVAFDTDDPGKITAPKYHSAIKDAPESRQAGLIVSRVATLVHPAPPPSELSGRPGSAIGFRNIYGGDFEPGRAESAAHYYQRLTENVGTAASSFATRVKIEIKEYSPHYWSGEGRHRRLESSVQM